MVILTNKEKRQNLVLFSKAFLKIFQKKKDFYQDFEKLKEPWNIVSAMQNVIKKSVSIKKQKFLTLKRFYFFYINFYYST